MEQDKCLHQACESNTEYYGLLTNLEISSYFGCKKLPCCVNDNMSLLVDSAIDELESILCVKITDRPENSVDWYDCTDPFVKEPMGLFGDCVKGDCLDIEWREYTATGAKNWLLTDPFYALHRVIITDCCGCYTKEITDECLVTSENGSANSKFFTALRFNDYCLPDPCEPTCPCECDLNCCKPKGRIFVSAKWGFGKQLPSDLKLLLLALIRDNIALIDCKDEIEQMTIQGQTIKRREQKPTLDRFSTTVKKYSKCCDRIQF